MRWSSKVIRLLNTLSNTRQKWHLSYIRKAKALIRLRMRSLYVSVFGAFRLLLCEQGYAHAQNDISLLFSSALRVLFIRPLSPINIFFETTYCDNLRGLGSVVRFSAIFTGGTTVLDYVCFSEHKSLLKRGLI